MDRVSAVSAKVDTIRFAVDADVQFLTEQGYLAESIVRRKVGWQEYIVAVADEDVLGFIQLEYLWSKVPYIALIRVLPGHRRQGIGKRMLHFVESFLYQGNYREIFSSSQADEPEPQAWHRHVGFEECGIIKEINDGVDEIFFRKIITGS